MNHKSKDMKKYIIIGAIVAIVAMIATIIVQSVKISDLKTERDRYKGNTEVLLQDISVYQTSDSLNAAKVGALELKLSEFERYRASDAELIKKLQTKNRDLEAVTSAQIETITQLRGNVRDSIVYLPGDTTANMYKCIDISDAWFSLRGCIDTNGFFKGTYINRDSILIAETVKYKRFLGFLWKTNKIKDREIDIVSKNPHTKIMGFEYILIEK